MEPKKHKALGARALQNRLASLEAALLDVKSSATSANEVPWWIGRDVKDIADQLFVLAADIRQHGR